ncbi:NAT SF super family protein [Kluyveromyces marxianus]|uniref:N-alpha-acetyltransferase 40 n=1 Tax=Kluyveromyces marxianus TaxID=4911 RepID=A0ABX6EZS7_KLUMA|nr:NAT SF super family protein [Kluyveromyces marxianus]BAP73065.1 NAT SF super family protein [Kluyveromyces marxianus]
MSNYNSRHLRLAAETLSTDLNGLSQLEVIFNVYSNRLNFSDVNYVNKVLPRCLQILKGNLGSFYEAHGSSVYGYEKCGNRDEWVKYKWNEMLEKDLVYITVSDRDNSEEICGFISFALSDSLSSEPEHRPALTRSTKPCLFLYEIHLEKSWQSRGLGSLIFSKILEPLASEMNSPSLELCVFTSNQIALDWYRNMGFKTSITFSKDLIGMSKIIAG